MEDVCIIAHHTDRGCRITCYVCTCTPPRVFNESLNSLPLTVLQRQERVKKCPSNFWNYITNYQKCVPLIGTIIGIIMKGHRMVVQNRASQELGD